MHKLKLTRVGDGFGIVLPADALAGLRLTSGEELYLSPTSDGLLLTPYEPRTRQQLHAGREFLRNHEAALRVLSE
jgi:antitoxin component of MazEF toxin-antitoxin module